MILKRTQLPHATALQLKIGRLSVLVILNQAPQGPDGPNPPRSPQRPDPERPRSRYRFFWTLGHGLLLLSATLSLYLGGMYAQDAYQRYAARGDTPVPALRPAAAHMARPEPFVIPVLQPSPPLATERITGRPPDAARSNHQSTVERVIIPSIGVDSKVVEVGWDTYVQDRQEVAVWQVAEYAVGQHRGSANSGEGGNIVLAGHVGGYGMVFKDLFYVQPGDPIILYSAGQEYRYVVEERLVLLEDGATPEQRADNARYIGPADHEALTMVTCWPLDGPNVFSQRVVVRAVPLRVTMPAASNWSVR